MADLRVHGATVTVNAPVHEVYQLFTHFDQFPKFMKFVKEVTYLDKEHQRTHWVADVFGHDEWDAVNEDWIEDRQIGWRSTSGLKNSGRVAFSEAGPGKTWINVQMTYDPSGGFIGVIVNNLGVSSRFDEALQESMNEFARLVDNAPPGGLNPNSPNYVFGKIVAPTPAAVSHMQPPGPTPAPGEPQDMVRQPVTGNMIDSGMSSLDLGTVGGGHIPGVAPVAQPGQAAPAAATNPTDHNVIDRTAQSNLGGRNPGQGQSAMGDRDVDATGSRRNANENVTTPMTARRPEVVNQTAGQAGSGSGENRVEDVESRTGEANPSQPPHEGQGSERRNSDFQRERGDIGQNPDVMPPHEATPANEEETRPQNTVTQNPAETGHEVE
jgi:uncharacterized membrane protein